MKNEAQTKINSFLQAWKDLDFKKMYALTNKTWKTKHSKSDLKKLITVRIKSFEIKSIEPISTTMFDADIIVIAGGHRKKIKARMLCESEAYKPSIDGEFGINPISLTRNLY
ncbi:hypothetical protein [Changchengzhania lutea]|uniref:hypothetical protein n=1 Tax=Changchengzhania lutea TaxID=2049305 RepID=UPI00115EA12B|nr:hypothetical protein [Changchengzhania lutea]